MSNEFDSTKSIFYESPYAFCLWSRTGGMSGHENHDFQHLPITEEQMQEIDLLFGQVAQTLPLSLCVVLTEAPPGAVAKFVYVIFEPLVSIVITLNHIEKKVELCADSNLFPDHRTGLTNLINETEKLLSEGKIVEALRFTVKQSQKIFDPSRKKVMSYRL